MQYLMLIYETADDFAARPAVDMTSAWRSYHAALVEAGVLVGGNALQPPANATTVRTRGEGRQVQDGPYADTKEQLGGFMVLELPSLDEALRWAERCPAAATGAVEIRPLHRPGSAAA